MGNPLDDLQAIRNNPLDDLKDIRSQVNRTSTPSPAEAARARLASRGVTPEMVKLAPPTAQPTYPGDSSSWFDSGVVRPDPRHFHNNLKSGGNFLGNVGAMVNPFSWVAPPMGELLAPTNPISTGNSTTNMEESNPNSSEYNPTMANLPDRLIGSVLPHPIDLAKEVYSRGEHGKTTSDMYAIPATMAATIGLPKAARGVLPADIAAELARKTAGSALGTTSDSFKHGATPADALLQEGGLVTRSEGRLLNKVTTAKQAELAGLEHDLDTPKHNNNFTDPMQSITPVLDDAMSRAVPSEQPKIVEFQTLLNNKIHSLSSGSMKLNPAQLVQLKRWLDGFIGTYKDEPVSTYKDLAQNTYSAVRQHLDTVAPEATVRGQKIQSLIAAEEAIKNKITGNVPAPHTSLGEFKNIAGTVFPSTLAKTGAAALLKSLSGGAFDKITPPTMSLGSNVVKPIGVSANPNGRTVGGYSKINLLNGVSITPREVTGFNQLPPPVTPRTTTLSLSDPFEFKPEFEPIIADKRLSRPKTEAKVDALTKSPADVRPEIAAANKAHNDNARKYLDTNYPLNGTATPPKVFKLYPKVDTQPEAPVNVQTPTKPTHVTEGTQVSGIDEQGNLISGNLEKLYPTVGEDGQPSWKGSILDIRNSRIMDLPADRIFDRLSGPPKSTAASKPKTTASTTTAPIAAPKSKLDALLDQFDDELPDAEDPKQAEQERRVTALDKKDAHAKAMQAAIKPKVETPISVAKKAMAEAPLDKGAASKKAVQDWLDKKALQDMEDQLGAGKSKKPKGKR